ncbi:hypothetical protein [Absidia glauca]|uniref:Uncharacterized protein n=1 Tax=Absidia glauca TaxID=4829 RepID=A0A168TDK3_ABSGL|nr:hypothetical protein [Absidia glauca]
MSGVSSNEGKPSHGYDNNKAFLYYSKPTVPNQYHPGDMEAHINAATTNPFDRRRNRAHRRQQNNNTSPTLPDLRQSPPPLHHHHHGNQSPTSPFLNNLSPTLSSLVGSPAPFNHHHCRIMT